MSGSFGNDTCKEIVENICPHCGEHLIMNKRSFANHVRWCKKNPKYKDILESTKKNVSIGLKKHFDEKFGEYKKFDVVCNKCGKHFEIQEYENKFDPNKKYFCSDRCSHSRCMSDDRKNKISDGFNIKSERYKEYYRKRYNKEYSPEDSEYRGKVKDKYKIKICPVCGNKFQTKSECCSKECAVELKNRRYYAGLLPDILQLDDNKRIKRIRDIYRKQCSFKFSLNQFPEEFDFKLIEENGWYKAKNHGDNLYGVSRDHKYSCNEGFRNLIDPYLISHPANCKLLLHSENSSKCDECSISIKDLIRNVNEWNKKYGEYKNTIDYELLKSLGLIFEKDNKDIGPLGF